MRRMRALARRYGHASMAQVHSVVADVRKLARDNAFATAGLVGAGAGAIMAGQTAGAAAIIGAVTGVAVEEITKK